MLVIRMLIMKVVVIREIVLNTEESDKEVRVGR
jgi:hypothetical protein